MRHHQRLDTNCTVIECSFYTPPYMTVSKGQCILICNILISDVNVLTLITQVLAAGNYPYWQHTHHGLCRDARSRIQIRRPVEEALVKLFCHVKLASAHSVYGSEFGGTGRNFSCFRTRAVQGDT